MVYTRNSAGQTVYYINGTQVSTALAATGLFAADGSYADFLEARDERLRSDTVYRFRAYVPPQEGYPYLPGYSPIQRKRVEGGRR